MRLKATQEKKKKCVSLLPLAILFLRGTLHSLVVKYMLFMSYKLLLLCFQLLIILGDP